VVDRRAGFVLGNFLSIGVPAETRSRYKPAILGQRTPKQPSPQSNGPGNRLAAMSSLINL